jgi:hypothetical protein
VARERLGPSSLLDLGVGRRARTRRTSTLGEGWRSASRRRSETHLLATVVRVAVRNVCCCAAPSPGTLHSGRLLRLLVARRFVVPGFPMLVHSCIVCVVGWLSEAMSMHVCAVMRPYVVISVVCSFVRRCCSLLKVYCSLLVFFFFEKYTYILSTRQTRVQNTYTHRRTVQKVP